MCLRVCARAFAKMCGKLVAVFPRADARLGFEKKIESEVKSGHF